MDGDFEVGESVMFGDGQVGEVISVAADTYAIEYFNAAGRLSVKMVSKENVYANAE